MVTAQRRPRIKDTLRAIEPPAVVKAQQPQPIETGDRVKGRTTNGEEITGFASKVGRTCLKLTCGKVLSLNSIEILARLPESLENYCELVGKTRTEKFDKLLEEYQFYNLSTWSTTPERSQPFQRYNGWQISLFGSKEVDIFNGEQTWYTELKRHPELKSNGDIYNYCKEAIDHAEGIIARIEAYESRGLGKTVEPEEFEEAEFVVDSLHQDAIDNLISDLKEELETSIAPSSPTHLLSLSDLAAQINQLHSEGDEAEATVRAAGKAALQLRKEEGDRLIQAKSQIKHGEWGTWLKDNCPQISDRSARLYMQLAEGWEELSKMATVADLTLREAMKLLAKKSRQQPALAASAAEKSATEKPATTPAPLAPGTEVYFNNFSGVITKLEGDRAIVKMDDGKFENLIASPPNHQIPLPLKSPAGRKAIVWKCQMEVALLKFSQFRGIK